MKRLSPGKRKHLIRIVSVRVVLAVDAVRWQGRLVPRMDVVNAGGFGAWLATQREARA